LLGGAAAAVAAEVVEVAAVVAVVADSEVVVVVVSEVADSEVVAEVSVVATAMAVATAMVATAAISAIAGADTFARTIERSVGPIRNQNEKGASIIRRTFFVNCPRASYIDAPLQRGGSNPAPAVYGHRLSNPGGSPWRSRSRNQAGARSNSCKGTKTGNVHPSG